MSAKIHLVVLLHGINTRALWMPRLSPVLEAAGFLVANTSYGEYPIARFLIPIETLRETAATRVLGDITTAIKLYNPDQISAVCHSFGTYVFGEILKKSDIKWHSVIFCGSVLPDNYSFDSLIEKFEIPILNEVGTHDILPALAESWTYGYGAVGSFGFNRPPVKSRWHLNFGHSDFLNEEFCRCYWIPFLRDRTIVPAAYPTSLCLVGRVLRFIPLRWIWSPLRLYSLLVRSISSK